MTTSVRHAPPRDDVVRKGLVTCRAAMHHPAMNHAHQDDPAAESCENDLLPSSFLLPFGCATTVRAHIGACASRRPGRPGQFSILAGLGIEVDPGAPLLSLLVHVKFRRRTGEHASPSVLRVDIDSLRLSPLASFGFRPFTPLVSSLDLFHEFRFLDLEESASWDICPRLDHRPVGSVFDATQLSFSH